MLLTACKDARNLCLTREAGKCYLCIAIKTLLLGSVIRAYINATFYFRLVEGGCLA
jgi:hypothetical protein